MAQSQFVDGVKFVTPTTGTGTVMCGAAVTGYRSVSALTNGATYSYWINDAGGGFESGQGVFNSASGGTLTRSPSQGFSLISLSGNAVVGIVARAEDIAAGDLSNLSPAAVLALAAISPLPAAPQSGAVKLFVGFDSGTSENWLMAMNSTGAITKICTAP